MLTFDPTDAFPLLPEGSHTYREAQEHAAQVDTWLGMDPERVESEILRSAQAKPAPEMTQDQQLWTGLPVQSLLTPYTELRTLLSQIEPSPGQTVIDLGAGYGRMGFVIGKHYPEVRFIGYEYVQERVDECQRAYDLLNYSNLRPWIQIRRADLSSAAFTPDEAEFYFLYDYGTRAAIEKTLQDLRAIAKKRAISVIGRGRASRDTIERDHPWLSQVVPPRHCGHYSIYRSE